VTIHLGILTAFALSGTGLTVPVFNIRNTAFGLEPLLERVALAGDLEDIEGLPLVVLYVAFRALNRLAHHSKEEIYHGTHVAMREGSPALCTEFYERSVRMVGRRGERGLTPLFIEGLVKVVQEPNEVFVAVVLSGLAEVLIDSALYCITDRVEEAHWSDVGGSVGRPHTLGEILVGEGDCGGHILLVGNEGGR
jgi:hypothetical protein